MTSPPRIASRQDALERAAALAPALAARAVRAEAERNVPAETIAQLQSAGLFGVSAPETVGGSALGFAAQMLTAAELGAACGSTAWVYGVFSGHTWVVGLFPEAARREVFADPHALTASMFRLAAKVEPVDGGYRVRQGEGRFCSGVAHADWLLAGCSIQRGDKVEPRFMLLPIAEVEVVDDWFTVGMRGTGSRSIRVADAFVPEHRTLNIAAAAGGPTPAALFGLAAPMSLVGAPLGMARGALAMFAASSGA
ncbi:MAG: acyl-CoA dehydrogenase family protein, partial [Caulobacteraceae bacterium]